MSTPTQPVKPLLPKKYYVRTFYFRLAFVLLNLVLGFQAYQSEDFTTAGLWIMFAGVWLFFAAADRKNLLRAEAFEQENGTPSEREAQRIQEAIEDMTKDLKDTNVKSKDDTDESVGLTVDEKPKKLSSYAGKYGVHSDVDIPKEADTSDTGERKVAKE